MHILEHIYATLYPLIVLSIPGSLIIGIWLISDKARDIKARTGVPAHGLKVLLLVLYILLVALILIGAYTVIKSTSTYSF